MSGCFLTSIRVSQKASKVVWFSHLFKNFPQIVVVHTVKGFSIVNEAEVDVFFFFELPCFLHDLRNVGNLIFLQGVEGMLIFCPHIFLFFVLSMGFSRQQYWSGLPFPSGPHCQNSSLWPVSILGSPAQHDSWLHWVTQAPSAWQGCDPWKGLFTLWCICYIWGFNTSSFNPVH